MVEKKQQQGNRLKRGMLISVFGFEGFCPWLLVYCFGSVLKVTGGHGGAHDRGDCLPHASEKTRNGY